MTTPSPNLPKFRLSVSFLEEDAQGAARPTYPIEIGAFFAKKDDKPGYVLNQKFEDMAFVSGDSTITLQNVVLHLSDVSADTSSGGGR